MEFIDLFSGAGGLSIGLEQAGMSCVAAVELDKDACVSFASMHSGTELFDCAIEKMNFRRFGGIPIVVGGPPCQPFSSGGKGMAWRDERDMIPEFIRAASEARPEAFMMENVPGLASPAHKVYFEAAISQLRGLGYTVEHQVLNAAEHGAPQKRRRLIVVGLRRGTYGFRFPQASHGPSGTRPFACVGEVLSLAHVRGEPNDSRVFYAKQPDLRPRPYDGHLFNGGGRAINLSEPCHTILASAGGNKTHFIDTEQLVPGYHKHLLLGGRPYQGTLPGARRLTVEESASVQTFPIGTKFAGSRSSQYKQVGNAVPPMLARTLGRSLAEQLRRA